MRSMLFIPADDEKKLAKGVDCRCRRADPRPGGFRQSVAQAGGARDRVAVHFGHARRCRGGRCSTCASTRSTRPCGRMTSPASWAAGPTAYLLPKARSGDDVHTLSIALNHAEERAGADKGSTRILALVTEVPISLLQLQTYVGSSSRLSGLSWGAEDLSGVIGAHANREHRRALDLALPAGARPVPVHRRGCRSRADRHGFVNFRDPEGLRAEANEALRDGFTGKMAIHPNQVAVINEVFTPTAEQIAHRRGDRQAFADNPQAGVLGIRGHMVDRPHLARAERILARAKAAASA